MSDYIKCIFYGIKTVVYTPDAGSGSGSGMMAMLAPLLQQKGIDPNLLMALNSKGNGNGFGGDGSWFLWIIFLFFLFPLFGRNGWGNNGESKVNVIDHNSSNVIGSDITNSKEVFAFINKREGIIRFVNFQTGGTTPAPTSVASK